MNLGPLHTFNDVCLFIRADTPHTVALSSRLVSGLGLRILDALRESACLFDQGLSYRHPESYCWECARCSLVCVVIFAQTSENMEDLLSPLPENAHFASRFVEDLLYSCLPFSEATYGHVDDCVSYIAERTRT